MDGTATVDAPNSAVLNETTAQASAAPEAAPTITDVLIQAAERNRDPNNRQKLYDSLPKDQRDRVMPARRGYPVGYGLAEALLVRSVPKDSRLLQGNNATKITYDFIDTIKGLGLDQDPEVDVEGLFKEFLKNKYDTKSLIEESIEYTGQQDEAIKRAQEILDNGKTTPRQKLEELADQNKPADDQTSTEPSFRLHTVEELSAPNYVRKNVHEPGLVTQVNQEENTSASEWDEVNKLFGVNLDIQTDADKARAEEQQRLEDAYLGTYIDPEPGSAEAELAQAYYDYYADGITPAPTSADYAATIQQRRPTWHYEQQNQLRALSPEESEKLEDIYLATDSTTEPGDGNLAQEYYDYYADGILPAPTAEDYRTTLAIRRPTYYYDQFKNQEPPPPSAKAKPAMRTFSVDLEGDPAEKNLSFIRDLDPYRLSKLLEGAEPAAAAFVLSKSSPEQVQGYMNYIPESRRDEINKLLYEVEPVSDEVKYAVADVLHKRLENIPLAPHSDEWRKNIQFRRPSYHYEAAQKERLERMRAERGARVNAFKTHAGMQSEDVNSEDYTRRSDALMARLIGEDTEGAALASDTTTTETPASAPSETAQEMLDSSLTTSESAQPPVAESAVTPAPTDQAISAAPVARSEPGVTPSPSDSPIDSYEQGLADIKRAREKHAAESAALAAQVNGLPDVRPVVPARQAPLRIDASPVTPGNSPLDALDGFDADLQALKTREAASKAAYDAQVTQGGSSQEGLLAAINQLDANLAALKVQAQDFNGLLPRYQDAAVAAMDEEKPETVAEAEEVIADDPITYYEPEDGPWLEELASDAPITVDQSSSPDIDWAMVRDDLEGRVQQDPTNAQLRRDLGNAYVKSGDTTAGILQYNAANRIRSEKIRADIKAQREKSEPSPSAQEPDRAAQIKNSAFADVASEFIDAEARAQTPRPPQRRPNWRDQRVDLTLGPRNEAVDVVETALRGIGTKPGDPQAAALMEELLAAKGDKDKIREIQKRAIAQRDGYVLPTDEQAPTTEVLETKAAVSEAEPALIPGAGQIEAAVATAQKPTEQPAQVSTEPSPVAAEIETPQFAENVQQIVNTFNEGYKFSAFNIADGILQEHPEQVGDVIKAIDYIISQLSDENDKKMFEAYRNELQAKLQTSQQQQAEQAHTQPEQPAEATATVPEAQEPPATPEVTPTPQLSENVQQVVDRFKDGNAFASMELVDAIIKTHPEQATEVLVAIDAILPQVADANIRNQYRGLKADLEDKITRGVINPTAVPAPVVTPQPESTPVPIVAPRRGGILSRGASALRSFFRPARPRTPAA